MTNREAIEAIKSNYPPANYSILREALDKAMEALEQTEWILCSEKFPEEREWMGTKRFGTTISDNVLVTVRYKDGSRNVKYEHFQNGELPKSPLIELRGVPVAWRPLPQPYEGGNC